MCAKDAQAQSIGLLEQLESCAGIKPEPSTQVRGKRDLSFCGENNRAQGEISNHQDTSRRLARLRYQVKGNGYREFSG
jgi:hypothetical protein